MRLLISGLLLGASHFLLAAHSINFDKIEHWTGEGPNQAALVIQFGEKYSPSEAYVWGFRWKDGETPNGEDMFKAICQNSDELVMLTQFTGQYGATLCGVGFGDATKILDNIYFDFEMALDYPFITFDYYNNNSWFGQEEAPGDDTPEIMQEAIENAKKTHVIQHPLDYFGYGYPAYDYDCWKLNESLEKDKWQSGWYEGYWSFWLSTEEPSSEWYYSGTGFTGAELRSGMIHGWTYTQFEEAMIGGMGEGNPPTDDASLINYRPVKSSEDSVVKELNYESNEVEEYYTLSGIKISPASGYKGFVIVKNKKQIYKTFIH